MAHEISTQVHTITGSAPVLVFEGTGKVYITSNANVSQYWGDSTIDGTVASSVWASSFATLVGADMREFVYPTKIYACVNTTGVSGTLTVKVRNWF